VFALHLLENLPQEALAPRDKHRTAALARKSQCDASAYAGASAGHYGYSSIELQVHMAL
jgi:hypothetical protein